MQSNSRTIDVQNFNQTKKRSITISTTANTSHSACKKRIIAEYLPKYRKKLDLERKQILPPSQDRLSELTIKQIDRLIEMEKIKDLLNNSKKGITATHICSLQKYPNRHPNVYQPNFLAKINKIAMERNIRHLRSEEFDETVLSPQQLREKGLQMQKMNLRFVKDYKVDAKKVKKTQTYQEKQEKSIGSIEDKLGDFEIQLSKSKTQKKKGQTKGESLKKYKMKQTNILSSKRWFNGMSTFYLDFEERERKRMQKQEMSFTQPIEYSRDYDFEFQAFPAPKSRNQFSIQYSRLSTMI